MTKPNTEETFEKLGTVLRRVLGGLTAQRNSGGQRETQPVRPSGTGEGAADPRNHGEDVARGIDIEMARCGTRPADSASDADLPVCPTFVCRPNGHWSPFSRRSAAW